MSEIRNGRVKMTQKILILILLGGLWSCNIKDNVVPAWEQPPADAADTGSLDTEVNDAREHDLDTTGHAEDIVDTDPLDSTSSDSSSNDTDMMDVAHEDALQNDTNGDSGADIDWDVSCEYMPDPASTQGLNAEQAAILNVHNEYRQRVGVAPLAWNASLAQNAQDWANACEFRIDPDRNAKSEEFTQVGENVGFAGGAAATTELILSSWTDQAAVYGYARPFTLDQLGTTALYTQMVWSATTDIGCGWFDQCEGEGDFNLILVCRYGPTGNIVDQTPYSHATGPCLDLDNDGVLQRDDPDDTDPSVP